MHPLQRFSNQTLNILFFSMLLLTVSIMLVMNTAGRSLNNEEAPLGIVSFELAGSVHKAQEILNSWDQDAQLRAAFIQGLDFLFLLVYSTTLAIATLWAGKTLLKAAWPPASLGLYLAWGLWLAAILDAVENIALVVMLFGEVFSPLPEIAAVCAIIKFALIFIGLVYTLYALVIKFVATLIGRDKT